MSSVLGLCVAAGMSITWLEKAYSIHELLLRVLL